VTTCDKDAHNIFQDFRGVEYLYRYYSALATLENLWPSDQEKGNLLEMMIPTLGIRVHVLLKRESGIVRDEIYYIITFNLSCLLPAQLLKTL